MCTAGGGHLGWAGKAGDGVKKTVFFYFLKSSPKCMKRVDKVLEVSGRAFWASDRRVSLRRCGFRWLGRSLR